MKSQSNSTSPDHQPRPWIDLLVSIVIPSVILMKFSGDEHLGSVNALILGLAFPLGWGLFELIRYQKKNFIALLGLINDHGQALARISHSAPTTFADQAW